MIYAIAGIHQLKDDAAAVAAAAVIVCLLIKAGLIMIQSLRPPHNVK
jgi:hypothetical protein